MTWLWSAALLGILGHAAVSPKTAVVTEGGPFLTVVVNYVVTPSGRARQMARLADSDGDGKLSEDEAAALDEVVLREASWGTGLEIDGIPHALEVVSGTAGGSRERHADGHGVRAVVTLRTTTPVFCGFHSVQRTETVARGHKAPGRHLVRLCSVSASLD